MLGGISTVARVFLPNRAFAAPEILRPVETEKLIPLIPSVLVSPRTLPSKISAYSSDIFRTFRTSFPVGDLSLAYSSSGTSTALDKSSYVMPETYVACLNVFRHPVAVHV